MTENHGQIRDAGAELEAKTSEAKSDSSAKDATGKAKGGTPVHMAHWSMALIAAISKPENNLFEDERVAIIRDQYGKAKFHFLVVAKSRIDKLTECQASDLDLLEHMDEKGS